MKCGLLHYDYSRRLEKESEERMTKLKDEALGKLKSLGNSILGNFGMSLDNFKMTQDPSTGSWNIRYVNESIRLALLTRQFVVFLFVIRFQCIINAFNLFDKFIFIHCDT